MRLYVSVLTLFVAIGAGLPVADVGESEHALATNQRAANAPDTVALERRLFGFGGKHTTSKHVIDVPTHTTDKDPPKPTQDPPKTTQDAPQTSTDPPHISEETTATKDNTTGTPTPTSPLTSTTSRTASTPALETNPTTATSKTMLTSTTTLTSNPPTEAATSTTSMSIIEPGSTTTAFGSSSPTGPDHTAISISSTSSTATTSTSESSSTLPAFDTAGASSAATDNLTPNSSSTLDATPTNSQGGPASGPAPTFTDVIDCKRSNGATCLVPGGSGAPKRPAPSDLTASDPFSKRPRTSTSSSSSALPTSTASFLSVSSSASSSSSSSTATSTSSTSSSANPTASANNSKIGSYKYMEAYKAGTVQYPPATLQNQQNYGLSVFKQGPNNKITTNYGALSSKGYPKRFGNIEGLSIPNMPSGAQLYEFPVMRDGTLWKGGNVQPGTDRMLFWYDPATKQSQAVPGFITKKFPNSKKNSKDRGDNTITWGKRGETVQLLDERMWEYIAPV